jgi:predicted anti-sigma-YlaC factor YlaD
MLTCKEVARLLSTDTAVEGTPSDRLRVKLHLLFCKHCRGYSAQLRAVGTAGRALWSECTGEQEAQDRLEGAILQQIERPGGSDAGDP